MSVTWIRTLTDVGRPGEGHADPSGVFQSLGVDPEISQPGCFSILLRRKLNCFASATGVRGDESFYKIALTLSKSVLAARLFKDLNRIVTMVRGAYHKKCLRYDFCNNSGFCSLHPSIITQLHDRTF